MNYNYEIARGALLIGASCCIAKSIELYNDSPTYPHDSYFVDYTENWMQTQNARYISGSLHSGVHEQQGEIFFYTGSFSRIWNF